MKSNKIIYWTSTGLLSLGFAMSSFMYLSRNPELMANFKSIGIPEYFVALLGVAKLLGAIAIVNPWLPVLKEWAYAGYTFTLIGAVWVHIATNTPFIAPLVFLAIVFLSYFYYYKVKQASGHKNFYQPNFSTKSIA